ncbi:MAG: 50S ribosomal protein L19 [Chlamydiales bacterium 38-26]|nr:50S ribosomal protein L19 [Chlamydiales bacterium]OJV09226.1 MAG: 50S ribosomal protein L19 [Chlamydiales bacterium 38-26]
MRKHAVIAKLESEQLKKDIPNFRIGDTIRVHTRIIEGEKERIQIFTGTVIARKGSGLSETFSLYRVAYGEGMERVFPLHSPRIAKLEIVKEGQVRRAKLYYLRGTSGKASKVKGRVGNRSKAAPAVQEVAAEAVEVSEASSEN